MKFDRQEIFRTVATLGAALLLGGWLRYFYQEELTRPNKWLMIVGGALVVTSAALNFRAVIQYFSRRSSKLGANLLVLGLAVSAVLAFLNFLGYRHHKRFDLTTEKLYTLSDQTRQIVGGLKQDVNVYFFAKRPDTELNDRMAEYVALSRLLHYQVVDPQERLSLAKEMGVERLGQLAVSSNGHTEKPEGTSEQDLTNAILKVTRTAVKTVCFVEGHGEKAMSSSEASGLKNMADELQKENYQTKSVNLVAEQAVPADCSAVVMAGPTKALFPEETQEVSKYLDSGGKALVMVDPDNDPKMDEIFQAWNVNVGKNVVLDASGMGRLVGMGAAAPLVLEYGTSPITRGFSGYMTFFPLARTISVADRTKTQPEVVELLKTSSRSFTKPEIPHSGSVEYDPGKDKIGPLSLGVAAERKNSTGSGKDARLVVIGDSDFATNRFAGMQRNGDLFLNAVSWLAQEEDLISIRPKNPTSRQITLTQAQQNALFIFGTILLPAAVLIAGIVIWLKRR